MHTPSPFAQNFDRLPATLPLFPLGGAVLLPHGHLPLSIFEPRYLNMIEDAMSTDHLVGMIQPVDEQSPPMLAQVGCAGRIVRYEETRDGRLEILLNGICRFEIREELKTVRGYRLAKPYWNNFKVDTVEAKPPSAEQMLMFKGVLRYYLQEFEIEFENGLLDKLCTEDMVNSLIGFLPLDNDSKQILLEAPSLPERIKTFTAILQAGEQSQTKH